MIYINIVNYIELFTAAIPECTGGLRPVYSGLRQCSCRGESGTNVTRLLPPLLTSLPPPSRFQASQTRKQT